MTESGRLQPLAVADWDTRLAQVVDDLRGAPLNVHRLMAHHAALLEAWWPLRHHVVDDNRLSPRHRELVILRVAWQLETWYEWASHVERGLRAGLTLPEVQRVGAGSAHPDWSADDALVLCATDECMGGRGIAADTRRELERHLDTPQLMDLIATAGVYVMLASMINTWGLALDDGVVLPAAVTEDDWRSP